MSGDLEWIVPIDDTWIWKLNSMSWTFEAYPKCLHPKSERIPFIDYLQVASDKVMSSRDLLGFLKDTWPWFAQGPTENVELPWILIDFGVWASMGDSFGMDEDEDEDEDDDDEDDDDGLLAHYNILIHDKSI